MPKISEDIFDLLFPEWVPFDPVGRVLSSIGFPDEKVEEYRKPFEIFRKQRAGEPLRLPSSGMDSEKLFENLFGTDGRVVTSEDGAIIQLDLSHRGLMGQLNLDNIGRDFLCLIYYRQKISDLFSQGGLGLVMRNLFGDEDSPVMCKQTSLNNSLLRIEALTDFILLQGGDFSRSPSLSDNTESIILTDPPARHLTLREFPSPVRMLRDSAGLSRYIRNLSTCLQDLGSWEDINKISIEEFGLRPKLSFLNDRRTSCWTRRFGMYIAMSREFSLWEHDRINKLPPIRTIAEEKGIPYIELLGILNIGESNINRQSDGFRGLDLIENPMSERLSQVFARATEEIMKNDPELGGN